MANDTIVLRTIYIQVFVKLFEELAHQKSKTQRYTC